jgi:tetratricopeptide (TPR) repeat protein
MRISWLSAEEIAAAREALSAGGAAWSDHFVGADAFRSPPQPAGSAIADWEHVTEHVARAERVSEVVREQGLEVASARFAGSAIAIEQATLAAAALQAEALELERVIVLLRCAIDSYVFYAPFLELMIELGREDIDRTVDAYEQFVAAYTRAIADVPNGPERVGAVLDGLADYYVSAGRLEAAEALFERRHDEDRGDVAVALSASRAFLAAGSVSHAVRWLGVGAQRATQLGRSELALRLRQKQERVRERLS